MLRTRIPDVEGVWRAGCRFDQLRPQNEKTILNRNSLREKFQLNSGTRLDRFLAGIYDFYALKPLIFPILTLELQVTHAPAGPARGPEAGLQASRGAQGYDSNG